MRLYRYLNPKRVIHCALKLPSISHTQRTKTTLVTSRKKVRNYLQGPQRVDFSGKEWTKGEVNWVEEGWFKNSNWEHSTARSSNYSWQRLDIYIVLVMRRIPCGTYFQVRVRRRPMTDEHLNMQINVLNVLRSRSLVTKDQSKLLSRMA